MSIRLNVGCGLDVRDGWVNIDTVAPPKLTAAFALGDARNLAAWHGKCELVLLNHVLHLFAYDAADQVLAECADCLELGGELVIVEPDILGVLADWGTGEDTSYVTELVADEVEPSEEGKLLRWITWHGTRRSLWNYQNLEPRLAKLGLWCELADTDDLADERQQESFVMIAHRP